jgi:hypothetical protein
MGAFFALGAILNFFEKPGWGITEFFSVGILMGVLPVAGGVYLIRNVQEQLLNEATRQVETALLTVLRRNNRITARDLALEAAISLSEAQDFLRKYQQQGLLNVDANEDGVIVYSGN